MVTLTHSWYGFGGSFEESGRVYGGNVYSHSSRNRGSHSNQDGNSKHARGLGNGRLAQATIHSSMI